MTEQVWHRVCGIADVPDASMRGVVVNGRQIVICHTRDGWHALDDVCSHAFALMHEGRLRGNRLICPLHGASFDCRTGAVLGAPATAALQRHEIRIVGDAVEVGIVGVRSI